MAQALRQFPFPQIPLYKDGGHLSRESEVMCMTYLYTLISGRTPVDNEPEERTPMWFSQKVGYEAAWHVGTAQVRAPGFKAIPINFNEFNLIKGNQGRVDINFLNRPKASVTVAVSTKSSEVNIIPTILTFTTDNYATAQSVSISVGNNVEPSSQVYVAFQVTSEDEVYNHEDGWTFTVSDPSST